MSKFRKLIAAFIDKVGVTALDRILSVCFALNLIGFSMLSYHLLLGHDDSLAHNSLWGITALSIALASFAGLVSGHPPFRKHKWPRIIVTAAAGLFFILGGLTLVGETSGLAISVWLYTGILNLVMVPIFLYMPTDFKTMLELNRQVENSLEDLDDLKDRNHE